MTSPWMAIVLAVALGVLVVFSPMAALGVAGVLFGIPFVVRRPYLSALGLFAWGAIRFGVMDLFGIGAWTVNAFELVVLAVVAVLAWRHGRSEHWLVKNRLPWILLMLFVVEALASWFVNRGQVLELLSGLRGLLLLPILTVSAAVLADDTDRSADIAWKVAVVLALVQIPIAASQYLFGGGSVFDPDVVVGTLGRGGANVLGVMMLAVVMHSFEGFSSRRRLTGLLGAVLGVAVMVMAGARLSLLLTPVAVAGMLLVGGGRTLPGRRVALAAGAAVVAVVVAIVVLPSYRAGIGGDLDLGRIVSEQMALEPGRVPRIAYIAYGERFVQANAPVPILGVGPGSAASGAAATLDTPKWRAFSSGMRLIAGGLGIWTDKPVDIPAPTQLTAVLVEYGLLGLLLYGAFVVTLGFSILRRCRESPRPGSDWRVFLMWFVFMVFGSLYANPWEGFSLLGLGFYSTVLFLGVDRTGAGDV